MAATDVAVPTRATLVGTAPLHDDARLVEALRRGDEGAFLELVDRYQGALLRLAALYLEERAAEALVRGAWLDLLRDLDSIGEQVSLKVQVFRALLDRAGIRERRGLPSAAPAGSAGAPAGTSMDRARFLPADEPGRAGHWARPPRDWGDAAANAPPSEEVRRCLRATIAGLPRGQREVITLRDVEGWAVGDVCDLLGMGEAELRALLHRARSRLWCALEGCFAPP